MVCHHLMLPSQFVLPGMRTLFAVRLQTHGVFHLVFSTQVVELCLVKYRDAEGLYCGSAELSYCTLRSQLLMALHDDNNPVSSRDRCHELAWTLDAGIMNGWLTDKHLVKLEKYFADVEAAEQQGAAASGAGAKRQKPGQAQDATESAGNATGSTVLEPYKVGPCSKPKLLHLATTL